MLHRVVVGIPAPWSKKMAILGGWSAGWSWMVMDGHGWSWMVMDGHQSNGIDVTLCYYVLTMAHMDSHIFHNALTLLKTFEVHISSNQFQLLRIQLLAWRAGTGAHLCVA